MQNTPLKGAAIIPPTPHNPSAAGEKSPGWFVGTNRGDNQYSQICVPDKKFVFIRPSCLWTNWVTGAAKVAAYLFDFKALNMLGSLLEGAGPEGSAEAQHSPRLGLRLTPNQTRV